MDSSSFTDAKKPTPNAFCFVTIAVAMVGAAMLGVDNNVIGVVQGYQSFTDKWCVGVYGDEISCDGDHIDQNKKWITQFLMLSNVMIAVGAALAAMLVAPIVASKLGRRPCMSIGGGLAIVGSVLTSYASSSVVVFLCWRIFTGFGVGTCCYALPMYVSEIAPPQFRGNMGGMYQWVLVCGGALFGTLLARVTDWQVACLFPGIPGAFVCCAVWLLPESPRFILQQRGREAARTVLQRVRSGDVSAELDAMAAVIEAEAKLPEVMLRDIVSNPSLRKRCFVGVWMNAAQQLSGVNCFLGFGGVLFSKLGMSNPDTFNMLFNWSGLVGVSLGLILLDASCGGRRRQLLIASVLMFFALSTQAAALSLGFGGVSIQQVGLLIYVAAFQFGWGLIPWLYPSEIFSMNERTKCLSIAVTFQYAVNAFVAWLSPILIYWNITGMVYVFVGFNLLNFLWVCAFVKETKGLPLEDVPALFGDNK